ncbi:hypothetical protein CVU83_02325 [Candidatus Falkowbacteria bacterium HGW-Falkowbacteria-2]|uniref:Uncharacterized protein n=1 Tax=Candidatus Falkowbacteria bacterium HGW-Falkowbacteria-2 TaxID=2013769 RepID=A0A2N2DZT6_9BACT|nr:MAG: hypothetical protein CVU83_02325 [Candidatus Falkowbacteria bacterium HGW-Falkowbacteria-2]
MKPLYIISFIAILAIGLFVFNKKDSVNTYVSGILVEYDSKSLITDSSLIAIGRVESIKYVEEESTIRSDENDIFTIAELQIEKQILPKDSENTKIYIKTLGGTFGNKSLMATDWPKFKEDERVLVFLNKDPNSDYYSVTGLTQGKYELSDTNQLGVSDEEREIVRKVFGTDMTTGDLEIELQ